MKTTIFSTHKFEESHLASSNKGKHALNLLEVRLTENTASLAQGSEAVSLFTSDDASAKVLEKLSALGVKYIALRTAGYNNVSIEKAAKLGIKISRVPAYSPYAIAEHTVALMLALNRKLIRAHNRVRDMNFSLSGLTGFDMNGKTVGVMGTGKIGAILIKILYGFGCKIVAYDTYEDKKLMEQYGVRYTDCKTLCTESDI